MKATEATEAPKSLSATPLSKVIIIIVCLRLPTSHPIPLNFPLGLAWRRRPIFTPFSSRKHNFSVGRLIACAEKLGGENRNWKLDWETDRGRKGKRKRERGGVPFASEEGKVTKATAVKFGGGGAAAAKERKKGFADGGFLLGHFPQSISAPHLSLGPIRNDFATSRLRVNLLLRATSQKHSE